jgi:hypothetical protein
MALEGFKVDAIGIERIKEAYLTNVGFPKVNAVSSYESMQIRRLAQDGELWNTETEGQGLDRGSPINHGFLLGTHLVSLQADLLTWFNTIKLSRGFLAMFGLDQNGNHVNMTQQTLEDFTTAPDGALLDGLTLGGTKLTLSEKERKIEYMGKGFSLKALMDWLYNSTQLGAYVVGAGQAGGTTRNLVDVSTAAYKIPGIRKIELGSTGQGIGYMESATLTMELMGRQLQNNVGPCRSMKVAVNGAGLQLDGTQALGYNTVSVSDQVVKVYTLAGEVLTFASGTMQGKFKFSSGYKGGKAETELEVELPYNLDDASPNHIDISSATAATFTY